MPLISFLVPMVSPCRVMVCCCFSGWQAESVNAEQLANISEVSGDAKSYDADDFDQFSDASRSTGVLVSKLSLSAVIPRFSNVSSA